jgi:hypothetical protein
MELAPLYRARRHRRHVADSISLALKAETPNSLALLIDTAIESQQMAHEAERLADRRQA